MVGILPALIVGFFPLFAALVVLGLSQTHTAQSGGASWRGFWDYLLHNSPGAIFVQLSLQATRYVLSKVAGAQLRHVTGFFGALAYLAGQTFDTNRATAENAARAMERLHGRERADVRRLHADQAHLRRDLTSEVGKAEAQTRHVGRDLHGFEATTRPQIKALRLAIDVTLPRDIGRIRTREKQIADEQARLKGRVGALEDGAADAWRWLRSHRYSATFGLFAGAVGFALTHLGLGWLKCKSNPFNNNPRACGLWKDLAGVLAGVVAFGGTLDFRDIVKAAVALEDEASAALSTLATLDDRAIHDAAKAVADVANRIAT